MRLIDADTFDKCLEEAEIEATKNRKYVFSSAINTIRGNLINFPTVNQWIPISVKLPEKRQDVIVTVNDGMIYTDTDEWIGTGFFAYGHNVIAWMPLPEPWKGEKNDWCN